MTYSEYKRELKMKKTIKFLKLFFFCFVLPLVCAVSFVQYQTPIAVDTVKIHKSTLHSEVSVFPTAEDYKQKPKYRTISSSLISNTSSVSPFSDKTIKVATAQNKPLITQKEVIHYRLAQLSRPDRFNSIPQKLLALK